MIEALAIDLEQSVYDETQRFEDPDDLLTLCGSLTINERGILKLAHYSVKEYLTSHRILHSPQTAYYMSSLTADLRLTQSCLLYLSYVDRMERETSNSYDMLPLHSYSFGHWFYHYKRSGRPTAMTALALDTLGDSLSTFNTKSWQLPTGLLLKCLLGQNAPNEVFKFNKAVVRDLILPVI